MRRILQLTALLLMWIKLLQWLWNMIARLPDFKLSITITRMITTTSTYSQRDGGRDG